MHEPGGPEVLVLEDVPDPQPGPGEVVVALRAAALQKPRGRKPGVPRRGSASATATASTTDSSRPLP